MTQNAQAYYEIQDAMDYEDAKVACKLCGLGKRHTDRRDCVTDLLKVMPERKMSGVISYLREQLADTGWTHKSSRRID